jgi:hypothetical protein
VSEELEQAFDPDRRTFIKRLVAGAFAAPVVASFTLSGVEAVFGSAAGARVLGGNISVPPDTTTTTTTTAPAAGDPAASVRSQPRLTG